MRNGDRRGFVAGRHGDRRVLLLFDLVAFAAQDKLVGHVVFFDGEPFRAGGRVFPSHVGLDIYDDLAAQALEADGGIESVGRGEPGVLRRNAQFRDDFGRFFAGCRIDISDGILRATHHAEHGNRQYVDEFFHACCCLIVDFGIDGETICRGRDGCGSPGDVRRGRRVVPLHEVHRAGGVVDVAERNVLLRLVADQAQGRVTAVEAAQQDCLAHFFRIVVVAFAQRTGQRTADERTGVHVDRHQVVSAGDGGGELYLEAILAQFDGQGPGLLVISCLDHRPFDEKVFDVDAFAVLLLFHGAECPRSAHAQG